MGINCATIAETSTNTTKLFSSFCSSYCQFDKRHCLSSLFVPANLVIVHEIATNSSRPHSRESFFCFFFNELFSVGFLHFRVGCREGWGLFAKRGGDVLAPGDSWALYDLWIIKTKREIHFREDVMNRKNRTNSKPRSTNGVHARTKRPHFANLQRNSTIYRLRNAWIKSQWLWMNELNKIWI